MPNNSNQSTPVKYRFWQQSVAGAKTVYGMNGGKSKSGKTHCDGCCGLDLISVASFILW